MHADGRRRYERKEFRSQVSERERRKKKKTRGIGNSERDVGEGQNVDNVGMEEETKEKAKTAERGRI